MAKVVITVDTKAGTLDVTVNGKTIENVDRATAYCGYNYDNDGKKIEKSYVDVHTREMNEENDVMTMTHIMAELKEKYPETSIASMLKG